MIMSSHHPPASDSQPEAFFSPRIRSRTASLFGAEKLDLLEEGPCTPYPSTPSFVDLEKKVKKLLLIILSMICPVMADAQLSDSNSRHLGSVKISAWEMK